ncbi:MAG TPA: hypothetical protein ENJ00_06810 [Phycisphaerales bacterium]|nr:hypothetical protein [Phycisphaerales bacterium]
MLREQSLSRTVYLVAFAGSAVSLAAFSASADPLEPVMNPNDKVSFLLYMADTGGNEQILNGTGPATSTIDSLGSPTSVGTSFNMPSADILVGWDEIFDGRPGDSGIFSRTRLEITTSDGSPFISQAASDAGNDFLRWEIGAHSDPAFAADADPFGFRNTVETVTFVEATVVFFQNDVQLNLLTYGFTIGIGVQWDGTDSIPSNLFTVGTDVNRIEITYDYDPTFVPAPACLSVLAGAGLMTTRRRRR